MDEEGGPRVTPTEALGIGLVLVVLDLIDLIPIAGDVTDILCAPINFYLYKKGINGVPFLVAELLDLIPAIQEFPSRTIAWTGSMFVEFFAPKEVSQALEKVGELAEGKEGELEGVGGEASALEQESAPAAGRPSEKSTERGAPAEESGSHGAKGSGAQEGGASGEEGGGEGESAEDGQKSREREEAEEIMGEPPAPMEDLDQEYFDQSPAEMMQDAEVAARVKEEEEEEAPRTRPKVIEMPKRTPPPETGEIRDAA